MAALSMTGCQSEDQIESNVLVDGDWQGYLDVYYADRWGWTGTTFETVMHFYCNGYGATSGRGYEVDYDTRFPFRNYVYSNFSWSIVRGLITLMYDEDWAPVYISQYTLAPDYFAGYMDDGTHRSIRFEFANVNFPYWSRYQGYYYGDYDPYYEPNYDPYYDPYY